jgi:ABC-2 type transport system permease protein
MGNAVRVSDFSAPGVKDSSAEAERLLKPIGFRPTNVLAMMRKELRSYFAFPLVYILSAIFLAIAGWYFYTDLVFFVTMSFNQDIIQNYWQLLFVDIGKSCLLLTLPFITMRLFAEERKLGTIELLYTYPLRDTEIFWGKFLASVAVFLMMLALTGLYPAYLYSIHRFPLWPLFAGYLGLILLGSSFIAFGIFVSSLCESQVVAGVVTIVALLLFWILTWNEAAFEGGLRDALLAFSMYDHFENFAKGVIDLYHVAFFVFAITFFSYLTLRSMEARKWTGRR